MKKMILIFAALLSASPALVAQSRVVLIEQFSNSSCPPCAAVSPQVYAFANNNTQDVAVIAYHTKFPYNNDSMYFENPVEATQRVNYYSVVGVPHSVMDGSIFNGSTNSFVGNMSSLTSNRLNVAPRYDAIASDLILSGNQLSGKIKFTSLSGMNVSENLVAQVVVIEKNVLKSSYAASPGANSETEYGYVMRKMLPDGSGTALVNKAMNGNDSVSFNWILKNIKNKAELRVVAFVQNNSTKEVYQAQLFEVAAAPVGIMENAASLQKPKIYPNPSNGEFTISFKTQQQLKSLSILDQLGRLLFKEELNLNTDLMTKSIDLNAGVYEVKIETASGSSTQKLIVTE